MLDKLLTYRIFAQSVFTIEHSSIDGATYIVGVEALCKRGEFEIVQNFKVSYVEALLEYVKKGTSVNLVITDDQVLKKTVATTGTAIEVLSSAYPNLDLSNFYYEVLQTSTKAFVAICRKSHIDTVIKNYKKIGIQITGFSLGNLQAGYVAAYQEEKEFRTLTASITLNGDDVSSIVANNTNTIDQYLFGDTTVASQFVLSLALVFKKMGVVVPITGNLEAKVLLLSKEFKEQQFFKNTLIGGIGLLLGVLLINFFVFSSSYSRWQQLQEQQQVYTAQKKQLETQIKKVKNKEIIVASLVNTGFSKSSWYTDQLIQMQPITVILENLSYQPIKKTPRKDKPLLVKKDIITVSGNSTVKEDFTNWLQQLEQLDFVKKVLIIKYGTLKGATAAFEIQLELIDETEK